METDPFHCNANSSLFKGLSLTRHTPVVVKKYDFRLIQVKAVQVSMVHSLNAALAQAKVQHPNVCDILEVQMQIDNTDCSIFHVLETLETDLAQDIEDRKKTNRPYTEGELRQVLLQTASGLAFAHSRNFAHRDVKPGSIFRTAPAYKLADFGCFFERDRSVKSEAGCYMSPQLQMACVRGSEYDAFKADVFALGASVLHMATLTSPETLEAVGRVETLSCSAQLKHLISGMLAYEEGARPTMQQICAALVQPEEAKLPTSMAVVWLDQAYLYDTQARLVSKHTLTVNLGGGSYIQVDSNTLLCVGTHPAPCAVHLLDLTSFQLRPLPSLCTPRAAAGLAKVNAHFYVFGGWNEAYLSSCEKLQLSDQCWTQTNSMHYHRAFFTPCQFRSLLYLASADKHKKVETFNVETDTFTVLPISLPARLLPYSSVAFVVKGELCLLTYGMQMVRWKIETEHKFRLAHTSQGSCSTQLPLVVGSLVLIACMGEVQKFSLKTYCFLD